LKDGHKAQPGCPRLASASKPKHISPFFSAITLGKYSWASPPGVLNEITG
jgi:hypothetical protein